MSFLAENESLTPLVASYLLNVEKIRVMPTLNGKSVLRIQPPLNVRLENCTRLIQALDHVGKIIQAGRTDLLVGHLLSENKIIELKSANKTKAEPNNHIQPSEDPREGRFAFLVHLLHEQSYADFDSSLQVLNKKQLAELSYRWNGIAKPAVIGSTRITSLTGEQAYGEFIVIQRTAEQLLALDPKESVAELVEATNLALKNGAKIIGLGGYTSVVTQGGRLLLDTKAALTTGNSFTVLASIDAVKEACRRLLIPLRHARVAIIGAGGSIGSAAAKLFAEEAGGLILVGNPKNPKNTEIRLLWVIKQLIQRLQEKAKLNDLGDLGEALLAGANNKKIEEFAMQLMNENGASLDLSWTLDCNQACAMADIVVTATSSIEALIDPFCLKPGAIICDVSRPPNVSETITELRPDVLVLDGGVVEVPGRPDLGWNFGFSRGLAYACMCETMMLGLEKKYEPISLGSDLNDSTLDLFRTLALKHGFKIAELRQFGKEIEPNAWDRLIQARRKKSPP